jgi:hypothetical protein
VHVSVSAPGSLGFRATLSQSTLITASNLTHVLPSWNATSSSFVHNTLCPVNASLCIPSSTQAITSPATGYYYLSANLLVTNISGFLAETLFQECIVSNLDNNIYTTVNGLVQLDHGRTILLALKSTNGNYGYLEAGSSISLSFLGSNPTALLATTQNTLAIVSISTYQILPSWIALQSSGALTVSGNVVFIFLPYTGWYQFDTALEISVDRQSGFLIRSCITVGSSPLLSTDDNSTKTTVRSTASGLLYLNAGDGVSVSLYGGIWMFCLVKAYNTNYNQLNFVFFI